MDRKQKVRVPYLAPDVKVQPFALEEVFAVSATPLYNYFGSTVHPLPDIIGQTRRPTICKNSTLRPMSITERSRLTGFTVKRFLCPTGAKCQVMF